MPEQNQISSGANVAWTANQDGSWSPNGNQEPYQAPSIASNSDGTYRVMGFVPPPPIQYILSKNIGEYVVVEFLIGPQEITRKQGVLFYVGTSFITLYDDDRNNFIVCDVFSVKFVYFYLPGQRPDFNVNAIPEPTRTTTGGMAAGLSPNSVRRR